MGRPNAHRLPSYLRKGADGSYFLDYYLTREDGGKRRVREKLGVIAAGLARQIAVKKAAELAERRFLVPVAKITFAEAADAFVEYSKSRKRSWKDDVRLVGVMKEYFGQRILETLNLDAVERFLNQIRERGPKGKKLAPATLNRYIAALKTLVNRAVNNNRLERNPIRGIKMFKENNCRDRTLTPDEYERPIHECNPVLRVAVQVAYETGMRRGEVFGLERDRLDLESGRVVLRAEHTKTNEGRSVPLSKDLIEAFKSLPRAIGTPLVFTWKGKALRDCKTAFKAACVRAGIKGLRFHDLRHCFVTNCRKAGVADHVIMSVTGHKTTSMLRRYDKVDAEDQRAALDRVRLFLDTSKKIQDMAA
jgi:integrase